MAFYLALFNVSNSQLECHRSADPIKVDSKYGRRTLCIVEPYVARRRHSTSSIPIASLVCKSKKSTDENHLALLRRRQSIPYREEFMVSSTDSGATSTRTRTLRYNAGSPRFCDIMPTKKQNVSAVRRKSMSAYDRAMETCQQMSAHPATRHNGNMATTKRPHSFSIADERPEDAVLSSNSSATAIKSGRLLLTEEAFSLSEIMVKKLRNLLRRQSATSAHNEACQTSGQSTNYYNFDARKVPTLTRGKNVSFLPGGEREVAVAENREISSGEVLSGNSYANNFSERSRVAHQKSFIMHHNNSNSTSTQTRRYRCLTDEFSLLDLTNLHRYNMKAVVLPPKRGSKPSGHFVELTASKLLIPSNKHLRADTRHYVAEHTNVTKDTPVGKWKKTPSHINDKSDAFQHFTEFASEDS